MPARSGDATVPPSAARCLFYLPGMVHAMLRLMHELHMFRMHVATGIQGTGVNRRRPTATPPTHRSVIIVLFVMALPPS